MIWKTRNKGWWNGTRRKDIVDCKFWWVSFWRESAKFFFVSWLPSILSQKRAVIMLQLDIIVFMSFRTYVRNLCFWAIRFLPLVEMTAIYIVLHYTLLNFSVNQSLLQFELIVKHILIHHFLCFHLFFGLNSKLPRLKYYCTVFVRSHLTRLLPISFRQLQRFRNR